MNLQTLQDLPAEVTKNVKLEISGYDLAIFAEEVATKTAQEVRDAIKEESKPDELLTRQQVAKMLGVTLTTLWHYDNKNVLNPVRIGSKVRYRRSDIEKALSK